MEDAPETECGVDDYAPAHDIPPEFATLGAPHKNVVTRRGDDLESYVRWQKRGGAIRVIVPFPPVRTGVSNVREKSIRVTENMTPEDAIASARHLQRLWTKRSLELRRRLVDKQTAARMARPSKDGLLGQVSFRPATHYLSVAYVDASGHSTQRKFKLPDSPVDDPEGVRKAKEEALEFVREMLSRGVETPIRRKYAGLTAGRNTHPLTMYFSTIPQSDE